MVNLQRTSATGISVGGDGGEIGIAKVGLVMHSRRGLEIRHTHAGRGVEVCIEMVMPTVD